jgi:exosortase D (VPLPA-CTERM-specific)
VQEETGNKNAWWVWFSMAALIGAFFLQYHVDVGNLLKRWESQDFSYCYLVPFLFAYLVYTNRRSLKTVDQRPSLWGFGVLFLSGVFYIAGRQGSLETLTYVAIWVAVVGLGLLLLGWGVVKALAFPFLILGFIVPVPPFLNQVLTFKLKVISSTLAVKMMQMAGLSVFREGNIIDIGLTQLQVVDACSGLRYVYPLVLMGLVFAYLFHKTWWERVLIMVLAVPISVLSNALRIAITGHLTIKVSPEVAEGFFHGFSGWLIFMVSFALLALTSGFLKWLRSKKGKQVDGNQPEGSTAAETVSVSRTKPSYAWLASLMLVAFWGLNVGLASTRVTPDRKGFKHFPAEIGKWEGEKSPLGEEILESLWADDYVQIVFRNKESGHVLLLFVPYYEYQGTQHTAHAPVSCLVGGGFAPRSNKRIERVFPEPFGKVEIKQMVLEKNRQLLLSNYWFHQRGRLIVSEYLNKWYLFWDSVTRRRTDGALVRIEMPIRDGRSVDAAQSILDSFTQELMRILPEYVPG